MIKVLASLRLLNFVLFLTVVSARCTSCWWMYSFSEKRSLPHSFLMQYGRESCMTATIVYFAYLGNTCKSFCLLLFDLVRFDVGFCSFCREKKEHLPPQMPLTVAPMGPQFMTHSVINLLILEGSVIETVTKRF